MVTQPLHEKQRKVGWKTTSRFSSASKALFQTDSFSGNFESQGNVGDSKPLLPKALGWGLLLLQTYKMHLSDNSRATPADGGGFSLQAELQP